MRLSAPGDSGNFCRFWFAIHAIITNEHRGSAEIYNSTQETEDRLCLSLYCVCCWPVKDSCSSRSDSKSRGSGNSNNSSNISGSSSSGSSGVVVLVWRSGVFESVTTEHLNGRQDVPDVVRALNSELLT